MVAFSAVLHLVAFCTPALAQNIVRINALGDSITGSPGCWRGLLWQKLQAAGVKNTDFVGTKQPDSCGFTYDGQHDGHGGFSASGIVRDNQLPGWLSVSRPDIVQLQLGTNDIWGHTPTVNIVSAMDKLVDQMRAQNPRMRILVAEITPMTPIGCSDCPGGVVAYNSALKTWASQKSTAKSPLSVVDCYTGFNTRTDTSDGVHPNSNGNVKLANCWYEPLKAAILAASNSGSPQTTAAIPSKTTTTTASAQGGGQVQHWGQCGGNGFTGSRNCVSPWVSDIPGCYTS